MGMNGNDRPGGGYGVRCFTPVFAWPRDSVPHPHAVYATPNGGKQIKPEVRPTTYSYEAPQQNSGFPSFSRTGVMKTD
jgi:hypothetical protein